MTFRYIGLITVSFAVGFFLGFGLRGVFDKTNFATREGSFVLLVVTMVWATSVFVDILDPSYTTNPMIHGLMGAIVGFFYKGQNKKA